jgi:deoxyribonuclease-1
MNPTKSLRLPLFLGLLLAIGACGPEQSPIGEEPADAGLDATQPADDAGQLELDAGLEPLDASESEADAGHLDAGDSEADTGQIDAGPLPYAELDSLHGAALEAALYDLVKNHHSLDYDDESKVVMAGPDGFDVIDGMVECIYTGQLFYPNQLDTEGGFNMEHSWPKSEGAGSRPAESDLHHLFPSERRINSLRSSHDFGDTPCTTDCRADIGGSKLGPVAGGTELVFQVRPERQGDIARAHFYFAVRYRKNIPSREEATLRRWNLADPPDDRERARNLAIEVHQENRNPFVERPDFVDRISDF